VTWSVGLRKYLDVIMIAKFAGKAIEKIDLYALNWYVSVLILYK